MTSSKQNILIWKVFQIIFWFAGIALWICLITNPVLGLILFWNVLIPLAPALLVIATGIWRNICPLSTTSLLPDKLRFSKGIKLTASQRATLNLAGIILLLAIIPLRHLFFNTNGKATAVLLCWVSIIAFLSGMLFERKSGWCSGLCPVHSVEKLYGSGVGFSLPNAHCNECVKCCIPCPDSTPNFTALVPQKMETSKAAEVLLIGGLPGYIWGWFHVADYTISFGWTQLLIAYGYPLLGATATIFLYMGMKNVFSKSNQRNILNFFAATAVSCYYWYRLPMLLGFDNRRTSSVLYDLSSAIPPALMLIIQVTITAFFFWWMVIRSKKKISWTVRPVYAD